MSEPFDACTLLISFSLNCKKISLFIIFSSCTSIDMLREEREFSFIYQCQCSCCGPTVFLAIEFATYSPGLIFFI